MTEFPSEQDHNTQPGVIAGNLGEAIKLSGLQLQGVSAEAARGGDTFKVWTRLSLTSDDRLFHTAAESLSNHVEHVARQAGAFINLRRLDIALLIVHPDGTGDLWADTRRRSHCKSWPSVTWRPVRQCLNMISPTSLEWPFPLFRSGKKTVSFAFSGNAGASACFSTLIRAATFLSRTCSGTSALCIAG